MSMSKKKQWFLAVIAIIILVAIDYYTKVAAVNNLADGDFVIWDGVLRFTLIHNTGAVFGLFSNGTVALSITSCILLVLIAFVYNRVPLEKRYLILRILLVFIMAGAIGNLIDRFAYGYVVDFIYIELIDFYVFNIADCYLTLSEIVLVLLVLFKYKNNDFGWIRKRAAKAEIHGDADESDNM